MTLKRRTVTRSTIAPEEGQTCNTYILHAKGFTSFCGQPAVLKSEIVDTKYGIRDIRYYCEQHAMGHKPA